MHWLQTSTALGKIASQCASLRLLALSRVATVKNSTEIGRAQFECAQGWAVAEHGQEQDRTMPGIEQRLKFVALRLFWEGRFSITCA